MKEFKNYCQLLKEVNKTSENKHYYSKLLSKRKEEYNGIFLTLFCLSLYSIGNTLLLLYTEGLFFMVSLIICFISTFLTFLFFTFSGYYKIKYFFNSDSKKELLVLFGSSNYYFITTYFNNYHNKLETVKKLHQKISTRTYLESLIENSKELNTEEIIILKSFVEKDNQERKKYFETIEQKDEIELMVI